MKKICIICGQEFETRAKRTICCKNKACRKQYNHLKYKNRTTECICNKCGKIYLATEKQKHDCCPDCVRSESYNYKNKIEQKHCCRQCKKVLFIEIKNVTKKIPEFIYDKTCDACKEKNYESSSYRMKMNNPSYKNKKYLSIEEAEEAKKLRARNKNKYKTKEEMRLAFSKRMKEHNPMYNKEVREKMRTTLSKKIQAGEINYNWKNSKYYKGDRGIKNYIRISLKRWRVKNFERSNYSCECCGAHGVYLHVHHKEKFSDIVEKFANELNLNLKTLQYGSEEYKKLEKLVNDYHKEHDIGLVVCENCHDKIDKCFHKSKRLKEDKIINEGNED